MADTRQKDGNWNIQADSLGNFTWPQVTVAVLMDIRDELKALNRVFHCTNFMEVPQTLKTIARNTRKKKRKAVPRPR